MAVVPEPQRRVRTCLGLIVVCIFVFLAVAAARLWYIDAYAVAMPYWDQWDAEGDHLLRRKVEGTLTFKDVFWRAHNEHRIVPTRLLTLAVFGFTGEWNNLQLARCSALVAAGVASLLAGIVAFSTPRVRARWLLVAAIALCYIMPAGWENILVGFQSQFHFLALASIAAIMIAASDATRTWWSHAAILALTALAAATMASGLITAVAVVWVYLLTLFCTGGRARSVVPTAAALAMLAIASYASVPIVSGHAGFRAQSPLEFADAASHVLGWPIVGYHWAIAALWLPGLAVQARLLQHHAFSRTDIAMSGLYAWSVAQGLAIAYGRGHGLVEVSSRYTDLLLPGLIASGWFAIRSFELPYGGRPARTFSVTLAATFGAAWFAGSLHRLPWDLGAMRGHHALALIQQANVERYLTRRDVFALYQPPRHIPYPDADRLRTLLDTPSLRAILATTSASAQAPPARRK